MCVWLNARQASNVAIARVERSSKTFLVAASKTASTCWFRLEPAALGTRHRERHTERDTEKDTQRETYRERHRERHRERGTERERERHRERETQRERHRERDTERETQRERERHRERDTERERERERHRERDTERETQRERERERERERHRERDTERETQRERERHRERERETHRERERQRHELTARMAIREGLKFRSPCSRRGPVIQHIPTYKYNTFKSSSSWGENRASLPCWKLLPGSATWCFTCGSSGATTSASPVGGQSSSIWSVSSTAQPIIGFLRPNACDGFYIDPMHEISTPSVDCSNIQKGRRSCKTCPFAQSAVASNTGLQVWLGGDSKGSMSIDHIRVNIKQHI